MSKLDIIYCRVSTEEQAGESKTSIPEQESKCREYLTRIGYNNIRVFQEDYSGFEFERPELDKIRQLIKENKVRSLTFLRVDRLSRQSGHLDQLREGYFRPYGIEVHSPGDLGKWEWTPSHIFLQNSLVNFANLWGKILVQVMFDGKLAKVKKGNTMAGGQSPFGYTEIKTEDKAYFVINDIEAATIRLIFRLFVEDGLSLSAIVRKLETENVQTFATLRNGTTFNPKPDGKWYPSSIRRILRNPTYVGKWQYGTITVDVPAIIDACLWQEAQNRLDENRREKRGRRTSREFLLSKRIKCSCGYAMAVNSKSDGKYMYYRCPSACGRQYYDSHYLDKKAFDWLCKIRFNNKELEKRIRNYKAEKEKALEPILERLDILEKLIQTAKGKYDRLLDLYLSSEDFSKEMLTGKKESLEKSLSEYQREKGELSQKAKEILSDMDSFDLFDAVDAVIYDAAEQVDRLQRDFNERRKFVEKYNLRATLINQDGKTYLHVTCKLGLSDLLELYTSR